jgi:hypothetical protein
MYPFLRAILILVPQVEKRIMTIEHKNQFRSQFVSHVCQALAYVEPSKYTEFMVEEVGHPDSESKPLWHRFHFNKTAQFMSMAIFLIPLSQVRQILSTDFAAVAPLVEKRVIKLDTSGLQVDGRDVQSSEPETDRYIDSWRKVVGKYV